jgi:hydrogenase 3 maturation protease
LLGTGSQLRGDDAWSFSFLEILKRGAPPAVHPLWGATVPENLLPIITRIQPRQVIVCDAGDLGMPAGSWRVLSLLDLADEEILSHRMPIKWLGLELEHRCACPVALLLVQPKHLEFSLQLSPEVRNTVRRLSRLIRAIWKQSSD